MSPSESGPALSTRAGGDARAASASQPRPGRGLLLPLVPVGVLLITFLFWYSTWFGRHLSVAEMTQGLQDPSAPHLTQHALSQLAGQVARGDPVARRWYPDLLRLASNPEPQLRSMTAWVMGQDNESARFHAALLKLVADPVDVVRWNAALALARFGDATGEPQLRLMLRPYELVAPQAGVVSYNCRVGDAVNPDEVVVHIKSSSGATELRSPLSGKVGREVAGDGTAVKAGDPVAILAPGDRQIWQTLQALSLVGRTEDLEDVKPFALGAAGMPEAVRAEALRAVQAIEKRAQGAATTSSPSR